VTDGPLRPRHRGPSPRVRRNRRIATVIAIVVVAALIVAAFFVFAPKGGAGGDETPMPTPSQTPSPTPTPTPTPTFPITENSIDDPASIWLVVNKTRPLNPNDYAPGDLTDVDIAGGAVLRAEAAAAMNSLLADFRAQTGLDMQSISSYRSYDSQVNVYNGWVSQLGQEAADLTSARPGYSEHQTGWAIDLGAVPAQCSLDQCFADTPQGQFLATNAWQYGFIVRYPDGYTPITGYEYEPWHMRYVGVELATEMHDTGVMTLEEFFGLPAAPDYP
jgi:zinc D-Ala-D-Ala carboxypeptidase